MTGTYDGQTSDIYLDGILRNQVNATRAIHYTDNNYVQIGTNAGNADTPDQNQPDYLDGGIDEVRIYNRALSYGEVMDDRFQCTAEAGTGILSLPNRYGPPFLLRALSYWVSGRAHQGT